MNAAGSNIVTLRPERQPSANSASRACSQPTLDALGSASMAAKTRNCLASTRGAGAVSPSRRSSEFTVGLGTLERGSGRFRRPRA